MAEFKLGRIRFVWQGTWASTTSYVVDDVVQNGGKSYICVINHNSSAAFNTDAGANPPKWALVSDGTSWRGDWTPVTYYNKGDLVKYGGLVYICKTVHESATNVSPTFLGLEADQAKWETFATSTNWSGAWSTGQKYRINDFVQYGGVTYICTTAHISAATASLGLEADIGKWIVFNQGIQYVGTWSGSSVRYKLNDVVKYGADLWICVTQHTSSTSFNNTNFQLFVNGLQFESSWANGNVYQIGDVATYGGYAYISKTNHTAATLSPPTTNTTDWDLFITGFNFQGEWTSSATYKPGDVVRRGGYSYISILDGVNQAPPNLTYWELLNSGLKTISTSQTYTAVLGSNVTGTGSGARFDIIRNGTVYAVSVTTGQAGTGYSSTNTIKVLGTQVGGVSPANDLIITVESVTGGAVNTVSANGISVTWTSGITYILGDVVLWGVSSYICVGAHVAGSGNRPDADTTATYWNLLAGGAEPAVLTTRGDIFYYSLNGPARLPIGTDGQVLRVTNGYPEWNSYGLVNNLVFVSPNGVDGSPTLGYGTTIDQPWKTVRFACQQVEKGYLNQKAKELIVKNKQFIMKEVTNWVTYNFTVNVSATTAVGNLITAASTATLSLNMPISFSATAGGLTGGTTYYVKTIDSATQFTVSATLLNGVASTTAPLSNATGLTIKGTLVYNSTKCERDVGIIVDAVAFDISHGGNSKSVEAALSYYTAAGNAYITANFGQQAIQTAAAYTYLVTLLGNILANTAPSANYQTLNGVVTTANQIIDTTLVPESGTPALVGTLVNIITDGILGTSATAIPSPSFPNTTISVKTGTYFENLPIVIPSNVAITGDELRSTVIQPAPAIKLLANDKPKSISALERIKSLLPNLVTNTTITPTSGNTVSQITTLPAGSLGSTLASSIVESSANLMHDIINNGISEVPAFKFTNVTGYNTTFLAGYGDGKAQIVQNYAFVKAEISAFLNVNYNAVWTALGAGGQASCQQDVGYLLDALQYDMTYGGNTQSLIAGSAYYSFSNLTIGSTEKTATLAAYNRLRTIITQIVQAQAVSASAGNAVSQVTTGTAGSAGAGTFAQARTQDIIDWITNGTAPTAVAPTAALALIDSNLLNSYNALASAKAEIQSDTVVWVKKFYQSLAFDTAVCSRDAGLIVDALANDVAFNSNFNSIKAGMSYWRNLSSTAIVRNSQKSAELGAINFIKYKAKGVAAGGVATASNAINDIVRAIKGGAQPRTLWADYSTVDAEDAAAAKLVWQNKAFIQAEIAEFMVVNQATFWANASSERKESILADMGNIVDALRYDLTYGGNYASRQVGLSYYVDSVLQITTAERTVLLTRIARLKTIVQAIASGGAYSTLQSTVTRVAGTAGDATSSSRIGADVDDIVTTITTGTAPTETLPATTWVATEFTNANTALQSARTTIRSNVITFINTNFPALVYDSTKCSRDIGFIIDGIGYDIMMGSNYRSILNGASYYRAQSSKVIGDQKEATLAAFNYLKTQIAATLGIYPNALPLGNALTQIVIDITDKGIGEQVEVFGSASYNNSLSAINGVEIIRANRAFLANEATAWISNTYKSTITASTTSTNVLTASAVVKFVAGDPVVFTGTTFGGVTTSTTYYVRSIVSDTTFTLNDDQGVLVLLSTDTGTMTMSYQYDPVACRRDMTAYLDAVIEDTTFVGNYRSLQAAKLYTNAIVGSRSENMFLVSNGSGLRNCTLNGLYGGLTNLNSFGTKRPTGGAYVSLNPGYGPNDRNVWVATRSHYSQNVTMFGTGCTGAKIDAALHAGGNKSMVKNDFTTILSDGIGVWLTGAGSLTELVSVFNYYGYAGYLAELGGRIRATNGNSSYGTYGVIAEGVDTYEIPKLGTMNNRANQAQVGLVVTDATTEVLRLEYTNAGNNYSNNIPTVNGSGYNIITAGDEFRDDAVFETRIIDLNNAQGVGGTSYATASNAAQSGSIGEITIAATDTVLTNGYNGMRIQITAGSGVGQYANILSYLNGSKVAQIYKDSFTNLTITGSTTTVLQTASTVTLYVNMPIYLSATTAGILTANTLYYVAALSSGTTFTVKSTVGGSAITGLTATSGQTITLYAAGWDHVIPGATIQNTADLTTAYIIEPRISYSAPGYTVTASTMNGTTAWEDVAYGNGKYVAIGATTVANYSDDGKTWASAGALAASSTWGSVVYGGGQDARATAVVGGLGGSGAVFQVILGEPNTTGGALADQVKSVTIISGGQNYTTAPTIVFGGPGSGAVATCAVLNGKVQSVNVTNFGSGYSVAPTATAATDRLTNVVANAWGRNYFSTPTVTIDFPAGLTPTAWQASTTVTNGTNLVTTDGNIYTVTSGGTTATTRPVHTSGSATDGSATLLWIAARAIVEPVLTFNSVGVAGVTGYTFTNKGAGYTATPTVTITDPTARFVAISRVSNANCSQTVAGLGTTWAAGTSTAKTDLAGLAYGNGIYVAVGGTTGTASAVSSTNGSTWIDRSSAITALAAGNYSAITYGSGRFMAIATGADRKTSYSTNGVTWTAGGLLPSAATTWSSVAYGNGRFVAIATGTAQAAVSIDRGANWVLAPAGIGASLAWTKVRYGQGLFVAIASATQTCATSPDGINWTIRTTGMPSSSNWKALVFGNPNSIPGWSAISNTSGTTAGFIKTGATTVGRVKVASGVVTETRMIEPGSSYPAGVVTAATGGATDTITVSDTSNLVNNQPIEFTGCTGAGLLENTTYYVIGATIVTNTSFKVSATSGSSTPVDLTTVTGLSGMYRAGPIVTVTDPNRVNAVALRVRTGDGVLGNPSFIDRGLDNSTATATISGDGVGDLFQPSTFINVANLFELPVPGANVEFASLPGQYFKLVVVTNVLGAPGNYTAQFQINPGLTVLQAPKHGDVVTTRLAYSQVRLTGHDFLYIGTGNKTRTNYPFVDATLAVQANQSNSSGGGRVFFTSTDQDGNFNVGNLFGVQQATGTATLNASAFNLSGLNSLQLGAVSIGVGSAIITQFSTDPFFTANSDNIVPTQRAIKAYITAQIGGGSSSLNVNTLTSGVIYVANNTISTTSGQQINITSKMNFTGGIDGAPVALGFFMQK